METEPRRAGRRCETSWRWWSPSAARPSTGWIACGGKAPSIRPPTLPMPFTIRHDRCPGAPAAGSSRALASRTDDAGVSGQTLCLPPTFLVGVLGPGNSPHGEHAPMEPGSDGRWQCLPHRAPGGLDRQLAHQPSAPMDCRASRQLVCAEHGRPAPLPLRLHGALRPHHQHPRRAPAL